MTLLSCQDFDIEAENEDQTIGANIIRKSLEAPLRQMAHNAGVSSDIIVDRVKNSDELMGWDFKDSQLVNMLEAGIVDPAKVTMVALKNSVSVASTLVTTNNAIVEE